MRYFFPNWVLKTRTEKTYWSRSSLDLSLSALIIKKIPVLFFFVVIQFPDLREFFFISVKLLLLYLLLYNYLIIIK